MQINTLINDIPKKPALRREWIKYQFRLRGYSVHAFAESIGVRPPAVSNAFWKPSSHIQQEIADFLGIPPGVLFPEFYTDDGRLIPGTKPRNRSRKPTKSHRSKGRAA
ncbi:MAG: nucleotide excision repair protein [Alphaproteobacteria bacterium]|nr:nucleotide excision repair protein [Alphaproteobacteria bacterium]